MSNLDARARFRSFNIYIWRSSLSESLTMSHCVWKSHFQALRGDPKRSETKTHCKPGRLERKKLTLAFQTSPGPPLSKTWPDCGRLLATPLSGPEADSAWSRGHGKNVCHTCAPPRQAGGQLSLLSRIHATTASSVILEVTDDLLSGALVASC